MSQTTQSGRRDVFRTTQARSEVDEAVFEHTTTGSIAAVDTDDEPRLVE